jgi:hypothetical protein
MCFILSEMIGFLFVISFLGLFILVPLRMVLALVSKLPYPGIIASAWFHIKNGAALTGKQVRWPVLFIYSTFFKACFEVDLGRQIHAQTLLFGGFASDLYLGNTMFDMYMNYRLLDYGRNVFDDMAERAAYLVIFKHRWHWQLSCWRPPWVPLTGGRGLRHLSRSQMMLAFQTFLELLGCTQSCIAASWCMLRTVGNGGA